MVESFLTLKLWVLGSHFCSWVDDDDDDDDG